MTENLQNSPEQEPSDLEIAKQEAATYFTELMQNILELRDAAEKMFPTDAAERFQEEDDVNFLFWSICRDNVNQGNFFDPMIFKPEDFQDIEKVLEPGLTELEILKTGGSVYEYLNELKGNFKDEKSLQQNFQRLIPVLEKIEKVKK